MVSLVWPRMDNSSMNYNGKFAVKRMKYAVYLDLSRFEKKKYVVYATAESL